MGEALRESERQKRGLVPVMQVKKNVETTNLKLYRSKKEKTISVCD